MENAESTDVGNVVNSRNICDDEGNDQARGEIREVGDSSTSVVGGSSSQENGEGEDGDNATICKPPDERRHSRQRSFSENDTQAGSAVRPPPLNLSSFVLNAPIEREGSASNSLGTNCEYVLSSSDIGSKPSPSERDWYSRGAYVDMNVFRYQPGVAGPPENLKNYKISIRGAALLGGMIEDMEYHPNSFALTGTMDIASEYERRKGMHVIRHHIKDHRAKQLLVVPSDDKFVALAAPEAFSRHSGTCMILGGQGAYAPMPTRPYELKLGHFLRIGSVGVVVSEIHTGGSDGPQCLSWEELTCLKGDITAIQKDLVTNEALTAREERGRRLAYHHRSKQRNCSVKNGGTGFDNDGGDPVDEEDNHSVSSYSSSETVPVDQISCHLPCSGTDTEFSSRKMCYMCFDDLDKEDNPLVAPCQCLGDTRYVHISCLQKWHTTSADNKVCVVLNHKGVRICTVCKTPYKASVRLPNGEIVALFQSPLPPPYICFMVVTKHLNNEDLFSTKYQLSFSSVINRGGSGVLRPLLIGRSRSCDMVLDYRTVSTKHAEVRFSGGRFYFTDTLSSNGSYLYMREPLMLPYGETVYLKWGSNVVSMKAKRSIRHRLSMLVGRRSLTGSGKGKNDDGMSILESLCDASTAML